MPDITLRIEMNIRSNDQCLSIGLAATAKMFDEEHQDLPRDSADKNSFLQRIGEHSMGIPVCSLDREPPVLQQQLQVKWTEMHFEANWFDVWGLVAVSHAQK
jgi:hypothetical protein